jgi:glucose-6-phosphate 1-dehydrogenase
VALTTMLNAGDRPAETRELELRTAPMKRKPYANLILEMLHNDPTLFIRGDEAEEAWRIIEPVMSGWAAGDVPMQTYPAGGAPPGVAR